MNNQGNQPCQPLPLHLSTWSSTSTQLDVTYSAVIGAPSLDHNILAETSQAHVLFTTRNPILITVMGKCHFG